MSVQIHSINRKEYFATKIVIFKKKEYQELKSVDFKHPSTIYAEIINGKLELVEDKDIVYALRVKYAMCVLSMHGVTILDYTLTLNEDEFVIENGKLVILNSTKRDIFDKYMSQKMR